MGPSGEPRLADPAPQAPLAPPLAPQLAPLEGVSVVQTAATGTTACH